MNGVMITVIALYNYDDTIFDRFQLPEGINKELCVDNILLKAGELNLLYPEPEIFKRYVGVWSRMRTIVWDKLYKTVTAEYNPLWNVDANVTETETRDLKKTEKEDKTTNDNVTEHDIERKNTGTVGNQSTGEDKESVKGFNSDTWAEHKKSDTSFTTTRTDNLNEKITDTSKRAIKEDKDITGTDTGTVVRETRRTGNIGVTASQRLIQLERDVAEFDIYDYITNDFIKYFCLLIY